MSENGGSNPRGQPGRKPQNVLLEHGNAVSKGLVGEVVAAPDSFKRPTEAEILFLAIYGSDTTSTLAVDAMASSPSAKWSGLN